MRLLPLVTTLLLAATTACVAAPSEDEEVGDESVSADALSSSIAIGTEVTTTTAVRFRDAPSTSARILRVLPKGTSATIVNRAGPDRLFYNVRVGGEVGWVHGAYLATKTAPVTAPAPAAAGCVTRRLRFSADELPSLPSGTGFVWGGNATGGEAVLDPPYASEFLARARQARAKGQEVFAYLEGPCGDTGGVDDGERSRCASLHNGYNRRFAPGTPDTAKARWKPYTMKQLTTSGANGVDYCEIDNLENNVTVPLNPLLAEIKTLFDAGTIHCRLVLKNVSASAIDGIRTNVAPTTEAANFIAPFHIFEAEDTGAKASLDAAMRRLKGPGAVTVISTDTNHYGGAFTQDAFTTCPR